MASAASESSDDMISGINITPLVDVVLVLLVVLMVTSSYLASQSIPLDLPKGATGESTTTVLKIALTRDGALYLNGEPVAETQFRERVRKSRADDHELRALIAADGGAAHRSVVHVIDLLRQEHVSKFALDVEPEAASQR